MATDYEGAQIVAYYTLEQPDGGYHSPWPHPALIRWAQVVREAFQEDKNPELLETCKDLKSKGRLETKYLSACARLSLNSGDYPGSIEFSTQALKNVQASDESELLALDIALCLALEAEDNNSDWIKQRALMRIVLHACHAGACEEGLDADDQLAD